MLRFAAPRRTPALWVLALTLCTLAAGPARAQQPPQPPQSPQSPQPPQQAWLLQVPVGGDFIALPGDAVLCGEPPAGFVVDATRKRVRPRSHLAPGYEVVAKVAARANACEQPGTATLLVTGDHPSFDPESVTVAIDGGRIELIGKQLAGVRIGFSADGRSGSDVCLDVERHQEHERCAVAIPQDLPADPRRLTLSWAPASGRIEPGMALYDRRGRRLSEQQMRLPIARILLQRMFAASRTADLGSSASQLQLEHPEALSSVECSNARCELADQRVTVAALPPTAETLSVRVRLLPRVFMARGESLESTLSENLTVLRCPLQVVSGEPPRGVDDVQILVRLGNACGSNADQLRWTVGADPVEVTRIETGPEGVYALLWVGRIARDRVTIMAARGENGAALAVEEVRTIELPPPNTGVWLHGIGELDFIPRNRDAVLTLSHVPIAGSLVPISVRGAYTIAERDGGFHIRGDSTSSGFTSVRFAYRSPHVPEPFADTDFAHVTDPVQRPIREASLPAPIGSSSVGKEPVVELQCVHEDGKLARVPSGAAIHIPFDQRNSCRLLLHRARIPADSGEQRLELTVTVTAVGGGERGEAHLSQQVRLRHGRETEVIWVRGAKEQFDRIDVRINHVIDESLFAHGLRTPATLPSSQWTIVTEDADLRFYATAAIPASLYRFSNDPGDLGTGPLSLNFGVLSRLTWLDDSGHEGLIGLEGGVMGMGLATDRERQLALVAGIGIALPLGNPHQATQAAINIHAWLSYTIGERTAPLLDEMGQFDRNVQLNPWAFVFGPSITVGSIGVFL